MNASVAKIEQPRLPPVVDPSPDVAETLAKTILRDGRPFNVFATLAHHPRLLKRFNVLGGFFLGRGLLPERDRELVILRIAWRTGSIYEFGQHTVIGLAAGVSGDEIAALAGGAGDWSPRDETLIAVADEIHTNAVLTDSTWERLVSLYDPAQSIEVILLAGFYRMLAGFLNTVGVERDPGVPGWPAQESQL